MIQFTYEQNTAEPAISVFAGQAAWFVLALAVVVVLAIIAKKAYEKKRGAALFLQNQDFSRLVYNVSHNITGFDFEVWVKELLLSVGYKAETTPQYNDHGIDVIAFRDGKKIGIQCKKYNMGKNGWTVGEPVLRDLYGVKNADGYDTVVLITTGNFTPAAVSWAEGKKGLVLINAKLLERIILNRGILKELLR